MYDRIGYVEHGRYPPGEDYLVLLRKRLG